MPFADEPRELLSTGTGDLSEAIDQLRQLGLDRLFEDPDFRGACIDYLRGWGCPALIARLAVAALAGILNYCKKGIASVASGRLLAIAERTPLLHKLVDRLIAGAKSLSDKTRMKDELIRNLRGETTSFTISTDHTTDLSIIKFLYEKRERDQLLATLDETVATPLSRIGERLDELFRNLYEPVLDDPRVMGRSVRNTERSADSLVAMVSRDTFRERQNDLDFLNRFLGDPTAPGPLLQFRWALLTGPAGEGKTRLAIEFLGEAEKRLFKVGFLPLNELKRLDPRRWQPRWATLFVIDYPAQSPAEVADLLGNFAKTASQEDHGFDFPVRALLLEREAAGDWFEKIVPTDSTGALVRRFCFHDGKNLEHQLTPISPQALLAIMHERLPEARLSNDLLWHTLIKVDPNRRRGNDGDQLGPRPLFAAATALAIADRIAESGNVTTVLTDLKLEEVLATIIARERQHFWTLGEASSSAEKKNLELHENLLAIATMALDLPRQKFDSDDCSNEARGFLPDSDQLNEGRYRRMAGGDPRTILKRLEPDILGEYFVLNRLQNSAPNARQALIDAGLALGGDYAAVFLIRCALDFGDIWNELGRLKPSLKGTAMRAFVLAAVSLPYVLDANRFDDAAAAIADAQDLTDRYGDIDPALRELLAAALFNEGVTLGLLGRGDEAIAVYDKVINRFGTATDPKLREVAAKALGNKGVTLDGLGRDEEAIGVYDEIIERFGAASEPALRVQVATALVNKGVRLRAHGLDEDAIEVYDRVIDWFGTASEPALRERVATAFGNKGGTLDGLGRVEGAITVYDEVVHLFGTASEPILREQVAKALYNKGHILDRMRDGDKAINAYDEIIDRFGKAIEPFLREQVAKALVNKGGTLYGLSRVDKAIAVFEEVLRLYGTANEPSLREQVAKALFNKGVALGAVDRSDDAIAAYDEVIGRFGMANESSLRESVAKAFGNKGDALERLGRGDEAIILYDEIIGRFGTANEPILRKAVAMAQNRKGLLSRHHL
jgi:tetratricopeptide (TPR) repeat protein